MFDNNQWIIYLSLVLIGLAAVFLRANGTEYSLIESTSGTKKRRQTVVYVTAFVLMGYIVFWAAIRNGYIDTKAYIKAFQETGTEINLKYIFFEDEEEKGPLFKLFQIILKRLGFSWQGYLAITAIITGVFLWYGISKYTDDVPFTMYLFVTSMYFSWLFNGIRQFLVVAVMFASLRLIVEKKLWKLLLLVFILYFVHKTVIIMIPLYFIANMKNWSYGIYACVLATMAVVLLFPNQFNSLIDASFEEYNYAEQIQKDDGVNILRFLVAMVPAVLAFVFKKEFKELSNPYINVMTNMSLISAGIFAVGLVTSGIYIGRLPIYADLYNLIFLPFLIKRVLPKNMRGPIWVACILLYFVHFYLQMESYYYTTNVFKSMNLGGAQL